jgi:hypothetical protein
MHEKLCDLLRIDILNTIWTPMRSLIFVDECRADPFVEIMPFQLTLLVFFLVTLR